MIRIDAIWLATEPLDMRAGADTILARVVKIFGSARPHHAYLFANRCVFRRSRTEISVDVEQGFRWKMNARFG